jgi:hypothetical protein
MGPAPIRPPLTGRRSALLSALLVLTACSGSDTVTAPTTDSWATSTTSTSAPAPSLPPPAAYEPIPGEPVPEAKSLAAMLLQTIGTYPVGEGTAQMAERRLGGTVDPSVIDAALPLLDPAAASSTEIVYPQLGGLTESEASVMVVFRQRLASATDEWEVTRTADVRLTRTADGWTASAIASVGGDPPPESPPLSAAARAVLATAAIDLPDSARWDIEAGRIDDRVLQLLSGLAEVHTLGVTVLATGHPEHVFGASSISNHTVGRGVDVWSVDGQPVIAQRDAGGPLQALVQQLLDTMATTELGSPWDLDGAGRGASFTNTVHQDHLHLAFDG